MENGYNEFIRILENKSSGRPVLFEPHINKSICEQIIWRSGSSLWDSPVAYVNTYITCYQNLKSDIVCLDIRGLQEIEQSEMFEYATNALPTYMKLVTICDNENQVNLSDRCDSVCAIAIYGRTAYNKNFNKPVIAMNLSVDEAIYYCANAIYIKSDIEEMYQKYNSKIALLGGVGIDYINMNLPVTIHARCDNLFNITQNKGFAIGTGNDGSITDYLGLISMLSIYIRYL